MEKRYEEILMKYKEMQISLNKLKERNSVTTHDSINSDIIEV